MRTPERRLLAVAPILVALCSSSFGQGADACSAAVNLGSVTGSFPFDTNNCTDTGVAATTSAEQQTGCGGMSNDVWFLWTAPPALDDHIVRFDTCNTATFDTEVDLWEGACGALPVGCNDDSSGCAGLTSAFQHTVTGGTTYRIQVGYWSTSASTWGSGTLQISDLGVDPCTLGIDDAFEENDSCASATPLAAGTYPGLYVEMTDKDYYEVTVADGDMLIVTADHVSANGDIDLFLYDDVAACTAADPTDCTGSLTCAYTFDDAETLTWTNSTGAAKTYVVRAQIWPLTTGPTCNNYDLTIFTGPDPCTSGPDDSFEQNDDCASGAPIVTGTYPGLFVSKFDKDYYEVTVANGDTLTVTCTHVATNGDIDLFLYDDVAACGAADPSGCAGSLVCAFTLNDVESISWTNNTGADKTYILRVQVWPPTDTGDCNDYDLEIQGAGPSGLGTNYCTSNVNSSGNAALISATGSDVAADEDVLLRTEGCPSTVPGLYFFGTTSISVVFGDGFRCAGGTIRRVNPVVNTNVNGVATRQLNFNAPYASSIMAGADLRFQLWFRDTAAGMSGFNLSNGLRIMFQ